MRTNIQVSSGPRHRDGVGVIDRAGLTLMLPDLLAGHEFRRPSTIRRARLRDSLGCANRDDYPASGAAGVRLTSVALRRAGAIDRAPPRTRVW